MANGTTSKESSPINESHQGQDHVDLPPFTGRKFENKRNDCYINATMNLLLSSNKIREGVMDSICKCPLCDFLLKVINDSTKAHKPGEVKSWASRFKPYFGGREQQDAEELLLELIKYCKNLKKATAFDTVDIDTLLQILYNELGVRGTAFSSFKSFLKIGVSV